MTYKLKVHLEGLEPQIFRIYAAGTPHGARAKVPNLGRIGAYGTTGIVFLRFVL
jgi:hypothetical protein